MEMNLDGKIAVITGGAQGIGFAISQKLASLGVTSVIVDIQEDKAKDAAKRICDLGFNSDWAVCDVSNFQQVSATFKEILDNHKKANMNAVLWQARQSGTAYYNSSFEPWGYYAGYRNPGYDPLAYAIEEAHKRGLELHAWFNVFAASSTVEGAPAAEHPEWICRDRDGIPMAQHIALSPGLEAVREYTIRVAMEIVRKYDIDGFHLDYVRWNEYTNSPQSKYFGKIAEEHHFTDGMITDSQIEELNNNLSGRYLYDVEHPYSAGVPEGFASWEEWWRWSVTEFVRTLHDSIQAVKPWVRLSAAVLGKYNWSYWQGYGTVYQDAALWFNEGYVDQLTPMHYHWTSGYEFIDMLSGGNQSWEPWIQKGIQDGRLYSVGPGSYQFAKYKVWDRHPSVVQACRTVPWVDGFQFFSCGSWEDYNYWEDAKALFFTNITKIRATKLIDDIPPEPPTTSLEKLDSLNYKILVNPPASITENHWFAIYRSPDDTFDVNNDEIIEIHLGKDSFEVLDHFSGCQDFNGTYYYFVTALDRFWNESEISNTMQTDPIPSFAPTVISTVPAEGDTIYIHDDIKIQFSKTIDILTFDNAVSFDPPINISQIIWSDDHKIATIQTETDFNYLTDYTLTIAATVADINGKFLDGNGDGQSGDPFILHFKTYPFDIVGPVVFSSYPEIEIQTTDFPIDEVITVVFDEIVDPNTVNNNTIKLYGATGLIPTNYKLTDINEKSVLSVQTTEPLENNANYTLGLLKEISDTLGNRMEDNISIVFSTSSMNYNEVVVIDKFLSLSNWEQPNYSGSTVGIIVPNTTFQMSGEAYLPSSPTRQRNSARLAYEWDITAAEFLLREYASGSAVKSVTFDTSYILQCHIFGDGSNNKFRFSLREVNGDGYPLEVSQWLTIDWYGWRIVEWDLSDPNAVGSWLGNEIMDGSSYYVDSFQLTHEDGALIKSKVFFDNLRIVKKTTVPTEVTENKSNTIPEIFQLYQNYPNPFNPTTTISFSIPAPSPVKLVIYNMRGREVATLINESLNEGLHQIQFDGSNLPSGVYIYQLKSKNQTLSRRMLLMK